MDFHIKVILAIATCALSVGADITTYVPQLTLMPIQGSVTSTTFTLDKPQCIFGSRTNQVWLLVARSNVSVSITNAMLKPPSMYSSFPTQGYYHVPLGTEASYPCSNTADYIRVGDTVYCTDNTYCNAPLPDSGPYRVKFVVMNNNALVSSSLWSGLITLRTGKNPSTIDTWPGRRSGGMIVLTSILSLLMGILTLCLTAAFFVGCKGMSRKKGTKENSIIQADQNTKNYKTHYSSTIRHQPDPPSSPEPKIV
ncbi:uroplakin-3b [Xenopus laevis]|uniref:Uncharacterized protein n=2 Tax=Xenopus laevis TaxID=8355 RepID=A0A974HYN0_XENLA|nr:uroplakin-3b [Xenopus laevis]OCT95015.1 hypothetical protein XELAEV_18012700mg [Xenopus laevis]